MLRDWMCILLGIHVAIGVASFVMGHLGWLAYSLIYCCLSALLLDLQAEPHKKEDYYDDFHG